MLGGQKLSIKAEIWSFVKMRGVDLNTIYITVNPKIDLERCFWQNELQKIPSWKVSYDIQTLK